MTGASKHIRAFTYTLAALVIPKLTHAATVTELIKNLTKEIGWFVIVGTAVALVAFLAGLVKFMAVSGDERAHEGGRKQMVWGIIGLFFILSVWGVVNLLQSMIIGGPVKSTCKPTYIDVAGKKVSECL